MEPTETGRVSDDEQLVCQGTNERYLAKKKPLLKRRLDRRQAADNPLKSTDWRKELVWMVQRIERWLGVSVKSCIRVAAPSAQPSQVETAKSWGRKYLEHIHHKITAIADAVINWKFLARKSGTRQWRLG